MSIPPLVSREELQFKPAAFVTARNINSKITQKWLDKNGFGGIPLVSVGMNKSKVEAINDLGIDIFIDDAYHNYIDLNENGIECLLMTRSHNLHEEVYTKRINNINKVINYILNKNYKN